MFAFASHSFSPPIWVKESDPLQLGVDVMYYSERMLAHQVSQEMLTSLKNSVARVEIAKFCQRLILLNLERISTCFKMLFRMLILSLWSWYLQALNSSFKEECSLYVWWIMSSILWNPENVHFVKLHTELQYMTIEKQWRCEWQCVDDNDDECYKSDERMKGKDKDYESNR